MGNELKSVRMTSVTLARYRQLKGRRRIIQGYRTVPCSVALSPDEKGNFTVVISNHRIRAVLKGTLIDDTINMSESTVYELRKPYLRKGFKTIVGYNLHANQSNV